MSRNQFVLGGLLCLFSVVTPPVSASAGGGLFDRGCGFCGGAYAPGQLYFTAPTYSYALPTITIVPHYIVQPNYVVERTYMVRPTKYVSEVDPCTLGCEGTDYLMGERTQSYSEGALFYPNSTSFYNTRHRYHYHHRRYLTSHHSRW